MSYRGNSSGHRGRGFGGFSFGQRGGRNAGRGRSDGGASNAVPPPPSILAAISHQTSKQGYLTMQAISQNAVNATFGLPASRQKTEEEYFDEEDDCGQPAYRPGPDSPVQKKDSDSDEEDPLDAFMNDLNKKVKQEQQVKTVAVAEESKAKGVRQDIEEEDDEESYYRYIKENPHAGQLADESDGDDIEYDADGNPIRPTTKKMIDPLPPVDHTAIKYEPFEKNFYEEHREIRDLGAVQVDELLRKLALKVTGPNVPKPVCSFAHFNFDETLMNVIRKSEFTNPTPIQSQAIPAALSGRDVIGIAQTGSGKTAAFLWPMIVHIMDQPALKASDGPIGIILAPTRELSQQIYVEARKFCRAYGLNVVCCYGGGSKWEQSKDLEKGAEIVVATPGRMIDMVKIKATNLLRTTFLVLDEADRMFDMGFEPQVRSICNHVRPDRQTLLFSATFKKRIEKLARDVLTDPIRVVQGDVGEANQDVSQVVQVMAPTAKYNWLVQNLVDFMSTGSVLIFVTKKANAEELAAALSTRELGVVALLHGDMDQSERNRVITSFKKKEADILVATDVAARGLDIPHIRTVVNYDVARDIDTHTHRIGRTGRAGEKGTAYTLVCGQDKEFAGHLVRNLEGANQPVPESLIELAMQSAWFRKSRFKSGQGRKPNVGGRGLGFKASSSSSSSAGAAPPSGGHGHGGAGLSFGRGAGETSGPSGPGGGRLAAMKAAFQAQYRSQFCSSAGAAPAPTPPPAAPTAPPPPIHRPPPPSSSSSATDRPSSRKKSRWDE